MLYKQFLESGLTMAPIFLYKTNSLTLSTVWLCLRSCQCPTLIECDNLKHELVKPLQQLNKKPCRKFGMSSFVSWMLSKLPTELTEYLRL
jgi:hypothetical protein